MDFLPLSDQFVSSVSDPDQIVSGLVDLIIVMFFEGITSVTTVFVCLGDGVQSVDVGGEFGLLSSVSIIGFLLSLDVEVFKSFQYIQSGVDGISSLSLEGEHVG